MLELWYTEKRTIVDFRRGPLGPHFDGFAAQLKTRGYSRDSARSILGKCCLFNAFLIENDITRSAQISDRLVDAFLDLYLAHTRTACAYSPRAEAQRSLKHLLVYLVHVKALPAPKPQRIHKPYIWLLDRYVQHLRKECDLWPKTIRRASVDVSAFLERLGPKVQRDQFKALKVQAVEGYVRKYLQESPANLRCLSSSMRGFFRFCALRRYTTVDFSALIPPVRCYRLASLPKGIEDSELERLLGSINKNTPVGARDYAIIVLMMAYGLRAVSVAELFLEDLDWEHSQIRIRAQKGGKEVILPLMQSVGDAIIAYLRHRPATTGCREVFLRIKAPRRPLGGAGVTMVVRNCMNRAGVKMQGTGCRSLRHSWAIRALGADSPIKAIADVLGHRYINTTFIYAKADLKTLREVAMPWPAQH